MVLRGDGEDRRFFLVQHVNGGHWDHPKGHPEAEEGPLEAARREIREEGGMEVDFIGDFSFEARWTLPDGRPKRVIYYLARARGKPSIPGRPEAPGPPEVPAAPEASGSPKASGIPKASIGPEVPAAPEAPGGPEASGGPKVPIGPEVPAAPEASIGLEVSGGPEASGAPEVPGAPEAPIGPEAPGGPEVPAAPEAPKAPAGPKAAPGGPDEILSRAWLPFEEAMERITYPSGRDVLEAARRCLEGPVPGK